MSEQTGNQFGRVARHSVAQALLTGCMSKSLQFVAEVLQGGQASCPARIPGSERAIADSVFLTREQSERLSSRCQECHQALNKAAVSWQQRDRQQLTAHLQDFRNAQRKLRSEIVAFAA